MSKGGERGGVERLLDAWWGAVRVVLPASDSEVRARAVTRVWVLVRAYYAFVAFLAMPWSSHAARDFSVGKLGPARLELWFSSVVPHQHWLEVDLVVTVVLTFAALVAVAEPRLTWPRILVPLTFAAHFAIDFDLRGKVDHGLHPTVWVGYAFAFLPDPRKARDETEGELTLLSTFFGAQVLVLLLYSCAGLCKALGIFFDFPEGPTWLHPEALPLTLAENWPKSENTLLAKFLITKPLLGWVLNAGVLALELFAVLAAFRPSLHRPYALALIGMHLAIMHSMAIHFHQSVLILLLLFVASPLAQATTLTQTLLDIPGVAFIVRRWRGREESLPESRPATGFRPKSAVRALWLPLTLVTYVPLAFSRLDVDRGEWEQDLYPVSAQWMYWRIDSSDNNLRRLERIRQRLENDVP